MFDNYSEFWELSFFNLLKRQLLDQCKKPFWWFGWTKWRHWKRNRKLEVLYGQEIMAELWKYQLCNDFWYLPIPWEITLKPFVNLNYFSDVKHISDTSMNYRPQNIAYMKKYEIRVIYNTKYFLYLYTLFIILQNITITKTFDGFSVVKF